MILIEDRRKRLSELGVEKFINFTNIHEAKVYGYIRVSTEKQIKFGISLSVQEDKINLIHWVSMIFPANHK